MTRPSACGVFMFLATLLTPASPFAQTALTDAAIRPLIGAAVRSGAGNAEVTISTLDKAVRAAFGDIEAAPLLFSGTNPYAALIPPYAALRQELRDEVAEGEFIDATLPNFVSVMVQPKSPSQPDIVRVVLTRDGKVIEPVSSTLTIQPFQNTQGVSFRRHAGFVNFPTSAFRPGATVVVALVPASGSNVELKLDSKALAKVK